MLIDDDQLRVTGGYMRSTSQAETADLVHAFMTFHGAARCELDPRPLRDLDFKKDGRLGVAILPVGPGPDQAPWVGVSFSARQSGGLEEAFAKWAIKEHQRAACWYAMSPVKVAVHEVKVSGAGLTAPRNTRKNVLAYVREFPAPFFYFDSGESDGKAVADVVWSSFENAGPRFLHSLEFGPASAAKLFGAP